MSKLEFSVDRINLMLSHRIGGKLTYTSLEEVYIKKQYF